jgi:hypothetical protein
VGGFRQLHPTINNVAKLQRKLCAVMQHGAFFVWVGKMKVSMTENQKKEKLDSLKNQQTEKRPILPEDVQKLIPELKIAKLPKDWCRAFFRR